MILHSEPASASISGVSVVLAHGCQKAPIPSLNMKNVSGYSRYVESQLSKAHQRRTTSLDTSLACRVAWKYILRQLFTVWYE